MLPFQEPIFEYHSHSLEETTKIAKQLSTKLKKGSCVAFFGELGAGKTTFIKTLVKEINNTDENQISSPTFTYLNIYKGEIDINHFDLYRIKDKDQFISMGFDEYFDENSICLIEWADKITPILPSNTFIIHIISLDENKRKIALMHL